MTRESITNQTQTPISANRLQGRMSSFVFGIPGLTFWMR